MTVLQDVTRNESYPYLLRDFFVRAKSDATVILTTQDIELLPDKTVFIP